MDCPCAVVQFTEMLSCGTECCKVVGLLGGSGLSDQTSFQHPLCVQVQKKAHFEPNILSFLLCFLQSCSCVDVIKMANWYQDLLLVASLLLVVRPGASSSFLLLFVS